MPSAPRRCRWRIPLRHSGPRATFSEGISPIGQKRPLPTVVDESAELFDVVYVSGGRRGLDLGLSPADLVAVTGATVADIAR